MEKNDISLMIISKIIVHDVPRHKKTDTAPKIDYSERESNITPELKSFFKDKLTEIINNKSFKIIFDLDTSSVVPGIIKELNDSKSKPDLVGNSKDLAKYLYDIQTGNNPAGILVGIEGTIKNKKVFSVMKLERDEGAQLKKNQKSHFIDIVAVKDLMLTKKTKLYKAGIFFNKKDFNADFDGYVTDNQVQPTSSQGIASFFIHDYLGCNFYGDTRVNTKKFFELTRDFITTIEDPIKKAKYFEHLISYTNMPKNYIDTKEFIRDYLEEVDQQSFKDYLTRFEFTQDNFIKDTELIETHLNKIMIDFENDVQIISKKGELGDKVKLSDEGNGITKAEVISKIKRVYS